MDTIIKMDIKLLFFIHDTFHNHIFDELMPVITSLGNDSFIWIILSLALLSNRKYRGIGVMCAAALILDLILGEALLKNIIQRPRPFIFINGIQLIIPEPSSYAFPSGHAGASFAVLGIIWSKLKQIRIPVLILAVLIAFSRIYLFVHYPLDVFAGAVLGLICSRIVLNLSNRWVILYEYKKSN